MTCKCGSNRILGISAQSKDMNVFTVRHLKLEHEGYVPFIDSIGGGDDIEIDVCCDCGQMQDFKPISDQTLREAFDEA